MAASVVIALIDPAGNGANIAAAASTPVVQSPADPRTGAVNVFRVTCTKAHSWKAYGFADASSTTLTDGTEIGAATGKPLTSGNGYEVEVFSDGFAGFAVVVKNEDGAAQTADIGVSRVIAKRA